MAYLRALRSLALALAITGCSSAPTTGGAGGSGGSVPVNPFYFPGQMVLDGHDVVLTIDGALIRTTPGGDAFTVLAGDLHMADPGLLVADEQRFYFVADSSLQALARSGGAPVKLADVQGDVLTLAVDASSLYWIELGPDDGDWWEGSVKALPLAGGAPVVLAAHQPVLGGLAVDATRVYWTVNAPSVDPAAEGRIMGVPLAGGSPATVMIVEGSPTQIALDGTSIFWIDPGSSGYFQSEVTCNPTNGRIAKAPLAGGEPVVLASDLEGAQSFIVSGDTVYFSAVGQLCDGEMPSPEGTVGKVAVSGGKVIELGPPRSRPGAQVVDGASLYFTTEDWDSGLGAVVVVPD